MEQNINAKKGRKFKYTPEEFEQKALAIIAECENPKGPIPTILYLESKMDIDFYRYAQRKQFSDITARIKKKMNAIYEQKASKGLIVPKIAAMKLAHQEEYSPVSQKMEVKADGTIDLRMFESLIDKAQSMDSSSREKYIEELKVIANEG